MGLVPTGIGSGITRVLLLRSMSETLLPFRLATIATLFAVSMATSRGLYRKLGLEVSAFPTVMVATTVALPISITETLSLPKLVTTAWFVVGLIATLVGNVPTVMVFLTRLSARLTIETELVFLFTTTASVAS